MTRMTTSSRPFLLGFERFERMARQAAHTDGYPPFNIEQTGDDSYRVTLAVAGFAPEDLDVMVKDNQLTIRGRQPEPEQARERVFLHRGIARRQFARNFILADGMEVSGAALENGLLHVDLTARRPEKAEKHIAIRKL